MGVMLTVVSIAGSILLTPFLMLLVCIIFLASIGKSLGVRRLYVKTLLMIFEYGRKDIESSMKRKQLESPEDLDEGYSEEITSPQKVSEAPQLMNGTGNGRGNSVISRDEGLIFVPELPTTKTEAVIKEHKEKYKDFELLNVVEYVKAGVEAIIEDQVTSRFEAEELKNWNFLIRTNGGYEFISWKLTFLWLGGFFIRYFFLFPLRLIICCFGLGSFLATGAIIAALPGGAVREWLKEKNYKMNCRIIVQCISSLIKVHNKEWRPARGSICVANHTSPMDVFILSTDNYYALLFFTMTTGTVVAALPDGDLTEWLREKNYKMNSRVIAHCLTSLIKVHNKEWRPARGSIAVANHTSPIDLLILGTDNYYTLVFWLTLCTALVGYVRPGEFKTMLTKYVSIMCFGILSRAISSVITYHNEENKPKNGICVANHTSPIDVLTLMCDNSYSLIGQRHGGFLGLFQRALARASPHIWFERSETRDRSAVANRLREHVSNPKNPPILIFPEGTCINNTSVMQFKKGSFEVGSVIYPVAIKYDPRFGDAFWNSSRFSMVQYLYMMMTSWAIVCDVWYLPPMHQQPDETAIDFANRVKSIIAKQGGLVDLMWDGQLKRVKAKKEWKERQQEEFTKRLKAE